MRPPAQRHAAHAQKAHVDVFKHFGVGTWTNSCKRGDVTQIIDPQLRQPVFRIAGAVPATNYIQIPKSASQSLGLSGTYLYFQFRTEPNKYFVVHIDTVTVDGIVVRISFSNLFREFRATSTWLQFPFDDAIPEPIDGDGPQPQSRRWTLLVLDIPAIYAEHVTRVYSHVKCIRLCGNLVVRRVFASDVAYNESALPKDVALRPPLGVRWADAFDCIRFPPPAAGIVAAASTPHIRRRGAAHVRDGPSRRDQSPKPRRDTADARPAEGAFAAAVEEDVDAAARHLPVQPVHGRRPRARTELSPDPVASLSQVCGVGPDCLYVLVGPSSREIVYACRAIVVAQAIENGEGKDADDANAVRKQRFFIGHTASVCGLALDARGTLLATAQGGELPCVRLWRYATAECLVIAATGLYAHPPADLRLSPEGVRLCVVGRDARDRHLFTVWDVSDARDDTSVRLVARARTDADIARVRIQPADVNRMATCGRGTVRFWRLLHANLRPTALRLPRELLSATFTDIAYEPGFRPNDPTTTRTAYVGCSTGDVLLVSLPAVTVTRVVGAHAGPITSLVACEAFLASSSSGADKTLRVWPLDMSEPYVEANHETDVACAAVGDDCMTIGVSCAGGLVGVLNVNARTYTTAVRCHALPACDAAQHPSTPGLFATCSKEERAVRVWMFPALLQVAEFASRKDPPVCLAWHPRSAALLAAGFESGAVRIFNVRRAAQVASCRQHAAAITSLAFSADGARLYTCAGDGLLTMYECAYKGAREAAGGAESRLPPDAAFAETADLQPMSVLVCSAACPRLAVSDEGGWVAFIAPEVEPGRPPSRTAAWLVVCDGRTLQEISRGSLDRIASRGDIADIAFVNDSQEIAVLGAQWELGLLDAHTAAWVCGPESLAPGDSVQPQGRALAMAVSPYRSMVAVVGEDRLMRVASTRLAPGSGLGVQSYVGMGSPVSAVAFADGGRRIVAGAEPLFLWDVVGDAEDDACAPDGAAVERALRESVRAGEGKKGGVDDDDGTDGSETDSGSDARDREDMGERSALTLEDIGGTSAMTPNPARVAGVSGLVGASSVRAAPPTPHAHAPEVHGGRHTPSHSQAHAPKSPLKSPAKPAPPAAPVAHHFVQRADAPPLALRRYPPAEEGEAGLSLAVAVGNNASRSPQPVAWDSVSGVFAWSVGCVAVIESLSTRHQAHITSHSEEVSAIALSPGGRALATACGPSRTVGAGQVCLWDLAGEGFPAEPSPRLVAALSYHDNCVTALAFSLDSAHLVSVGNMLDPSVALWDARDGRFVGASHPGHPLHAVCWCPPPPPYADDSSDDGDDDETPLGVDLFVAVGERCILFVEAPDPLRRAGADGDMVDANDIGGMQLKVLRADIPDEVTARHFTAVCFGPPEGNNGRALFVGGSDGSVTRWDARARVCTSAWNADTAELSVVLWTHRRLFTAGQSAALRRWSVSDTLSVESEIAVDGGIVALQPDLMGEVGVAASATGTLWYVDFAEGATIRLASSHTGRITGIDMPFGGSHIVSSAEDGSVRVWATGGDRDGTLPNAVEQIAHFQALSQPATCACAFVAGDRCAAGYGDGTVRVFSVRRVALETKFAPHSARVTAIAVDCGGRFIVSGSAAGVVVISAAATGITLRSISDHKGAPIACIRFDRASVIGDDDASETESVEEWGASRMVRVAGVGVREDSSLGEAAAAKRKRRPAPRVPTVPPAVERFVVTSDDRRLSVWRCEWLRDTCELEEWLTFPGPAAEPSETSHAAPPSPAADAPDALPSSLACFLPQTRASRGRCRIAYTGFGFQKELILFDVTSKKILKTIPLTYWATSLDVSPDASLIAVGCRERLVKLIDAAEGTFQDYAAHADAVAAVRFDAAGNRLVTAAFNAMLVWDVNF